MMTLTKNAMRVFEKRYLWRDNEGKISETPEQLFRRVAACVASPEKENQKKWERKFFDIMVNGKFLPNSPTLMNAGKRGGQLSACFVLPLEDSLEGIFSTLKFAVKIHQSGGGTGFSFSNLRPKGSPVQSTRGVASGPVSFLRIFDVATETIKQGGSRRGANMGVLRVDHPDIFEFVEIKKDLKSVVNFNLSVGVTEEFIRAVQENKEFSLQDPRSKKVVRTIKARDLFDQIVNSAWLCGDPGLIFLDRINEFNPTPALGPIETTNPCGEQPLLPYESCNLGSLNLEKYIVSKDVQWDLLKEDIWAAVRFLDNVIDVNHYPVPVCGKITKANRKIGLGVMGFADALLRLGVLYESKEAVAAGEQIMHFIHTEGKRASAFLAGVRGPFPNWQKSRWCQSGLPPLRNATVTTVAPTGTISILAGCSSGIEPIFSAIFYRHILDGEQLKEIHPMLEQMFRERGISTSEISEEKAESLLGPVWQTSRNVSVEGHIEIQSVFQKFCDSAVSKTINLPASATSEDIAKAYLLAHQRGCKGITVFRDQSRGAQVLEAHESCPDC